ncbi:MAG: hypothetical protein ACR2QF_09825, partial [Geminicoccaceae bacterium]
TADQKRLADRLPHGDFRLIESGGHELLMECPVVRQKVFEAFSTWTGVEISMTSDQTLSA